MKQGKHYLANISQMQKRSKKIHTYKNLATYNGEFKGGFRHGTGIMTWADGAKYDGQWNFG